ncbi:transcription-repair coupling factor (superfamily II helicase) [Dysgonomonas sp. PFB1-18]|uniref:transcription-repair coupling factor n=2 Tax=unclassified Dysgonomonas TaxID=2630389 RepID=UPI0024750AAD|nr:MULTISPECIES: transcription-repair coupling factor [unclassified Dysgonomonas]MDH6308755.1 transcription-repair coupling factor (superfamily II helicase) [Dysgonomonas sp. PF1-14]MDH6338548.1 transcription-repair coupling factor (superfamily II helicase) [Dysgonomonas sp. PF1-16]MDH6380004.1 transcription-repair coupling factor (superfamily II helicase) [Dysgonomonas sp. PFB1-18]MDH6397376.1 transcription-repair coupling factor (superfamily II helicase) [Dysgonomonas sp. PF1-23]
MELSVLQEVFETHKNVSAVVSILAKHKNIYAKGLQGSSASMFAAALFHKTDKCFLYVLNDQESAGYFYHDLTQILGADDVLFFPSAYKRAIKYGQIDPANEILRTEVLGKLQTDNKHLIIVTYPEALAEKVVSKTILEKNTIHIKADEEIDRGFVSDMLDSFGFEYVDYVYEPGQYAIRGSILDVFSFSYEFPYRIDFFGDEVSTIRTFDIETQLSKEKFQQIQIIPDMQKSDLDRESFLKLIPKDSVVGFSDFTWAGQKIEAVYTDTAILDNPEYEKDVQAKLTTYEEYTSLISTFKHVHFGARMQGVTDATIEFNTDRQHSFHKNFDLISETFHKYIDQGFNIYILSDSEKQHKRLKSIFEDREDNIDFIPVEKTLSEGFIDETLKICCFTDHQLFDRYHKYNLKSDRVRSGKFALSLKELQQFQIGDYIVHIDHGVGQFGGLVRSDMNGKMQELIKLIYLNNDSIFVSLHALHKISKYRGKEGEPPRINKLGTGAWNKIKEKTKSKVKDIARDLIQLYAKRRQEEGFKFSPDSFLQNELEASFIYEDTPDQVKATADVKLDMENVKPMDRLICGDVGFGKTEVAIRAAFKAVTDNKQVAVLVPTTVLAYQHYQTFKDRLKDFPCKVEYISRARSNGTIKETLDEVKEGKVDILIGTHRIVSKDVKFKDLGLLIIDEEQKFGVAVKEKLKQMKSNVDTLTMTATPIPRTLQFSLMGARDLSSITTPPPNRYPIQTEVHTFDPYIIREAINFEMSRNGQVFFINNRIKNIYELEDIIRREVPDARIAVGHGQMDPAKLEAIIIDFVNHEYDVLLATSIIESGIDIPNANTIIVNNAQNFGLSDLHQLRGRVGRSNKKAFAYLLAPPLHTLTPEARRRLQAIENFSELGHGFHIAMQDLDIRGAGNLLGAEQSGFIADLGYEVYQKILTEAVNELKNEEFSDIYHETEGEEKIAGDDFVDDVQIESDLELLFPATYIPNDSERITIYRELDNMEHERDVLKFMERLEDRFGKIPPEGRELIMVVRLRALAKTLGIEKVVLKGGRMSLFLVSNPESPYYQSKAFDKLLDYIQKYPRSCELKERNGKRSVSIQHIPNVETACMALMEIMG